MFTKWWQEMCSIAKHTFYSVQVTIFVTCLNFAGTSFIEFESLSDPLAKNRIEFQWGSKLQGTSSEALVHHNPGKKIGTHMHVNINCKTDLFVE